MVSATLERQVLDAAGRPATVLVVEEHDLVRAAVAAALARAGYVVLCAESGEQALRLVARYGAAVDLVLTAVVLPGISGPILAGRLLATSRARRALFMSGYSGDDLAR